jgi:hypothetical protein
MRFVNSTIAIVPVTVVSSGGGNTQRQASEIHPGYSGTVLFKNTFTGKLAATEYPKVNVSNWYSESEDIEFTLLSFILQCSFCTASSVLYGVYNAIAICKTCFRFR